RIANHIRFDREQLIQDRCAAVEFPRPTFQVAADGTQSSIFDVTQVVEGSCQSTLTDPNPHVLDAFQPIVNPDPDFFGTVAAIDRRPGFVRFDYTHPTAPPADGQKFRVIRIGIFYIDRRNPGAGERLVSILEIRIYRPPVLMIHGLWSDANAFTVMDRTLAASNYEPFQLFRLDSGGTNDSSFADNVPLIAGGLRAALQGSADAHLAAGKVDLVTHSMGGVLSRLYLQDARYQHEVRRLITSNAPHAGSQMANLLLDADFDSPGIVCSMLSQVMSPPTAPNRSCKNGAVEDLQVTSPATNDLNLGVHPPDVAVHAVTTVLDLADLPDLSSLAGFFGGPAASIIAELRRGCALSLVDQIFDRAEPPPTAPEPSAAGGPRGPLRSAFLTQAHMALFGVTPAPVANPAVIARVKQLLQEPGNSSSFTRSGFSPGQLTY